MRYEGPNFNAKHDWDYRLKYHVPMFKDRMTATDARYVAEWWVTNESESPVVDAGASLGASSIRAVVHYPASNPYLGGLLVGVRFAVRNEMKNEGIPLDSIAFRPDLPASGIGNEFIVETILPGSPILERTRRTTMLEALSFPELVGQLDADL